MSGSHLLEKRYPCSVRVLNFLGAEDLVRVHQVQGAKIRAPSNGLVKAVDRIDAPPHSLFYLALPVAKARVVDAAGLGVEAATQRVPDSADSHPNAGPLDAHPSVVLANLPLRCEPMQSWFEALDEIESWRSLRRAVAHSRVLIPDDAHLFEAVHRLAALDHLCATRTFPHRSL